MERMERVLSHFEQEAKDYDDIIIKLIPDYEKMVSVLVDFIGFDTHDTFSVIDLGCGAGTLSKAIAVRFPNAAFSLVRKKAGAKPKRTAGVICIVAGIGIIISGIVQSLPL